MLAHTHGPRGTCTTSPPQYCPRRRTLAPRDKSGWMHLRLRMLNHTLPCHAMHQPRQGRRLEAGPLVASCGPAPPLPHGLAPLEGRLSGSLEAILELHDPHGVLLGNRHARSRRQNKEAVEQLLVGGRARFVRLRQGVEVLQASDVVGQTAQRPPPCAEFCDGILKNRDSLRDAFGHAGVAGGGLPRGRLCTDGTLSGRAAVVQQRLTFAERVHALLRGNAARVGALPGRLPAGEGRLPRALPRNLPAGEGRLPRDGPAGLSSVLCDRPTGLGRPLRRCPVDLQALKGLALHLV
mmetsp:Transcript_92963/g.290916  ORF Transcript_92963/g.290916 Transcript_92963/m.290916 type:complete len:294 (+) Transcript_92963:91-972(+)